MQDHRLGFPAVLAALYPPEQRAPSISRTVLRRDAEADIERSMHDEHVTGQLVAPAVVARHVEPAYVPEFDRVRPSAPVVEPIAEAAPVADEWQSTAPPCAGWYGAQDDYDRRNLLLKFSRYWHGDRWSVCSGVDEELEERRHALEHDAEPSDSGIDRNIQWRGPRLIGDAWPEPEAPKAASFTITIKAGGGGTAGSSGGAVAHGVGGACSGAVAYSAQDCRAAYLAAPSGKDRRDLAVLQRFVPGAGAFKDLMSAEQVPEHRRAEFIAMLATLKRPADQD